jgi:glycerol-3-phosphate dehydrogenase
MRIPAQNRPSLDGSRFDVIIIGGGINGVAIARECARSGARTLVIEQHDFASGTTSRSTRIIHGGLRYLEHGEIGLVRESLRDRERLLREQSHLVRPMSFLLALPAHGRHSAMAIRAGLWFYGAMAGHRGPAASHADELERLLDTGQAWSLFHYDDAQCEFPERLVAEWLRDAMHAGAAARNYTRVIGVETAFGDVRSVIVRDLLSHTEARIDAAHIINATGPWVDQVCAASMMNVSAPLVGGVRGTHLLLPMFPGMPETAVYTEATDGRPIFLVPWNKRLLVGTTEVRDTGDPSRTEPSPEEIEYLFSSVRKLFPSIPFEWNDVECAFAGVRPLPYSPADKPSAITRRHRLHDHAADGAKGMITVVGGKLTTAASLARECARAIGLRVAEREICIAAAPNVNNIENALREWARQAASLAGVPESTARAIAEWHGRSAMCIARTASTDERLRRPLCPHSDHIVAEALEAIEREGAARLSDILLRRVPVGLGACWSADCTYIAARRIGAVLGWDEERLAVETETAEEERINFFRPVRGGVVSASERAS